MPLFQELFPAPLSWLLATYLNKQHSYPSMCREEKQECKAHIKASSEPMWRINMGEPGVPSIFITYGFIPLWTGRKESCYDRVEPHCPVSWLFSIEPPGANSLLVLKFLMQLSPLSSGFGIWGMERAEEEEEDKNMIQWRNEGVSLRDLHLLPKIYWYVVSHKRL